MKHFLNSGWLYQQSWKVKLPIIVGLVFIISSLPFVFGVLIPSIHEGNPYSMLYVLVNMPALFVFGDLIGRVEPFLFTAPNLYKSNLVCMFFLFLFWLLTSFVIGIFIDLSKGRISSTQRLL